MSPRYEPRPVSDEAKKIAFEGDVDALQAFIDAPIEPSITPLDRRFVLSHLQRRYLDALLPEKVIEVTRDALYTYDRARPHLLMSLAEAHEILGNLDESERLVDELESTIELEDPRRVVDVHAVIGLYNYRVGAYRLAIEHFDRALEACRADSPHFAVAAAVALRALAHLGELDREPELRARFHEEFELFAKISPHTHAHLTTIRAMWELAEVVVAARKGDRVEVERALGRLDDAISSLGRSHPRLEKRRAECETWAWIWIGDADRARAAYDAYRKFLTEHAAPLDRAVLVAAAAQHHLGIDLVTPEEVAQVRHPAILFHASRLMQEANPTSEVWRAARDSAAHSLPERLRKHVG